ncbi:hypothetical protein GCM10009716_34160 [Streptomyces sodiiphilus]|uniref:Tetratricopeptide repeat protein n=1 Tax=Streptomyces sodiiphilus TaxID=226217 RepID=A0ABN2PKK6_9ACTN
MLLDNALDSAQVRDLLPTEAGSAALVTGRTVLTGLGGAHHLHIGTLAPAESIALVRTVAPGSAERGSREEWEELAALCGHLPLALRILAHRMASRPQWRVADWNAVLRDERSRMDELTAPDVDLRASLTVTIDQLAAGADPAGRLAAAMFPLLGAATVRSYSPDSAAAVTGCTPREAAHALERLTDAQLTTSPRPGTYTLHDLVRAAAARQASRLPEPRTNGRVADLARWYLGSMYRVNEPLAVPECFRSRSREGIARFPQGRSFTDGEEALRWADDAVDDVVLLAAQLSDPRYDTGDELAGKPLSSFAPESIWALDTYFGRRLSWHAQQRLCDLALTVGRRRGDVFARAVALGMTGKSLGQQGEGLRGAKLLEEAVELYRSLGEPLQAVRQLHNIVPCLGSAGKLTEAVDVAGQALAEAESLGFEEIRVSIVNNLARCHLLLGGLETAHRLLTGNYAATAHLPYEHTKAAGVLAEYHLARKEFEEAAHWARRSLEHAAEQPFDPYTVAEQRMSLAAAWRGLGREERARAEETAARAILEDFDHRERTRRRAHGTGGGGR